MLNRFQFIERKPHATFIKKDESKSLNYWLTLASVRRLIPSDTTIIDNTVQTYINYWQHKR